MMHTHDQVFLFFSSLQKVDAALLCQVSEAFFFSFLFLSSVSMQIKMNLENPEPQSSGFKLPLGKNKSAM